MALLISPDRVLEEIIKKKSLVAALKLKHESAAVRPDCVIGTNFSVSERIYDLNIAQI